AEDGIRDDLVTGVQTCALPISAVDRPPTARSVSAICEAGDKDVWQHRKSRMSVSSESDGGRSAAGASCVSGRTHRATVSSRRCRSEERRVGKESEVVGGGWGEM